MSCREKLVGEEARLARSVAISFLEAPRTEMTIGTIALALTIGEIAREVSRLGFYEANWALFALASARFLKALLAVLKNTKQALSGYPSIRSTSAGKAGRSSCDRLRRGAPGMSPKIPRTSQLEATRSARMEAQRRFRRVLAQRTRSPGGVEPTRAAGSFRKGRKSLLEASTARISKRRVCAIIMSCNACASPRAGMIWSRRTRSFRSKFSARCRAQRTRHFQRRPPRARNRDVPAAEAHAPSLGIARAGRGSARARAECRPQLRRPSRAPRKHRRGGGPRSASACTRARRACARARRACAAGSGCGARSSP